MDQKQYDLIKQAAYKDELEKIALSKEEFNKIDKLHDKHFKKHKPAYISNIVSGLTGGAAGTAGGVLLSNKLLRNIKGGKGEVLRGLGALSAGLGGSIVGAAGGASTSDLINSVYRKGFAKERDALFAKTPDSYLKKVFEEK